MPLDTTSPDIYDSPDSSPGPYASPSSTPAVSKAELDSLPGALPYLGRLAGYTDAHKIALIEAYLAHHSQHLQSRPLTGDEKHAIAYYAAKAFAISSWGPTLGFAAGLYRTYATRRNFGWPFSGGMLMDAPTEAELKENPLKRYRMVWDGQRVWSGRQEIMQRMSIQTKASVLHCMRGFVYCGVACLFVKPVVDVYAISTTTVGFNRDPRVQDIVRLERQMAQENWRREMSRSAGIFSKQADAKAEGKIPNRTREWDQGKRRGGGGAGVDDASPTGGAMMDMGIDEEQGRLRVGDMGGVLGDGQMRSAEAATANPARSRAVAFQTEKNERQPPPEDFSSDFDDASPTGGIGAADSDGGSVWERIRQQSASEPSNSSMGRGRAGRGSSGARREQREGSTSGDGFAFSRSSEERSYAKAEAQREFDERVEKERRGGEF